MKKIFKRFLQGKHIPQKTSDSINMKNMHPDITDFHWEIIDKVKPYTMTSIERIIAVIDATLFIVENDIEGDIVECGVWRGGSMMAIAYTLMYLNEQKRNLYLFDTYEGMIEPNEKDKRYDGKQASDWFDQYKNDKETGSDWCFAGLQDVERNLYLTGYQKNKLHFIKGKVEDTLLEDKNIPNTISILRLDTDWYDSTKLEFVKLYPSVSKGGIVLIDDYGHWQGAKLATDEYLSTLAAKPFLNRIDYTCRSFQKTADAS